MTVADLQLGYAGMIVLGLMVLGASRVTKDLRAPGEKRQYYAIQAVTIVCALVGAKLGVLMGDARWPMVPFHDWALLAGTGRSIAGALLFGFIGAELAKPLMRYRLPPNDRFATVLPFSIAIGRIGCLLAGCCLGEPWNGPWAVRAADGVLRHPAPVYEMVFNVAVGVLFAYMLRRRMLFGRLFALYLVLYGAFRFAIEFVRATPKDWPLALSGYQWLALAMVVAGGAVLVRRTLVPPPWRGGALAGASS